MSLVALTLVALLAADQGHADIHVVAVRALNEEARQDDRTHSNAPVAAIVPTNQSRKRFGRGLEEVERALAGLSKYNAFDKISAHEQEVRFGSETSVRVHDRYTLFLKPKSKDDRGRVQMNVRIEMSPRKQGEDPVNVVANTTVAMVPGKQVNLGGLRLDEGELVIVLWVGE